MLCKNIVFKFLNCKYIAFILFVKTKFCFFQKIGPQFPFSGKQKMRSTNVRFTDAGANIAFFFCMPKFAGFYFAIYFVKNLSGEMLLP